MQGPVLCILAACLVTGTTACYVVSRTGNTVTTTDSALLETAMQIDFVGRTANSKSQTAWTVDRRISNTDFFFPSAYSPENTFPVRYVALFAPVVCASKSAISFCSISERSSPEEAVACFLNTSEALCETADKTLVLPSRDMAYSIPPRNSVAPSDSVRVCVDTLQQTFWTETANNKEWFALAIAIALTFIGRMMFSPWDKWDWAGITLSVLGAFLVFGISSVRTTHTVLCILSFVYCAVQLTIMLVQKPNTDAQKRARVHGRGIVLISTCIFCLAVSNGFAFSLATIFAFRSWKHMYRTVTVSISARPIKFDLFLAVGADIAMLVLWGLETVPGTVSSIDPAVALVIWVFVTLLAATSVVSPSNSK